MLSEFYETKRKAFKQASTYLKTFTPITINEDREHKSLKMYYTYVTPIFSGLIWGLGYKVYSVFNINRLKANNLANEILPPRLALANSVLVFSVFWFIGRIIALLYTYEQTAYIHKRLYLEKGFRIDRKEVLRNNGNVLFDDYPFVGYDPSLVSDAEEVKLKADFQNYLKQNK